MPLRHASTQYRVKPAEHDSLTKKGLSRQIGYNTAKLWWTGKWCSELLQGAGDEAEVMVRFGDMLSEPHFIYIRIWE